MKPASSGTFSATINTALLAIYYSTRHRLRQNHPAWRLLCAQHTLLVAGFLRSLFIVPNVRILSQPDLIKVVIDTQWLADFNKPLDKYFAATGKTDGERR